jgi:hypothetical protein
MNGSDCRWLFATVTVCFVASLATAQEANVVTVLSDLHDPRGIAVRPSDQQDKHEIYVAEAGAGRIVRLSGDEIDAADDAITGFPEEAPPVALLFIDRDFLVVGCRGTTALRLFQFAEPAGSLSADSSKQQAIIEDGNLLVALARTRANDKVADALVAAFAATDGKGSLAKIPLRASTLGEPTSLRSAQVVAPMGITVSEQGFIVLGDRDPSADSTRAHLKFLNPITGQPVMELSLELAGLAGLAFSPRTGHLYAIATAASVDTEGGLFRIDSKIESRKPGCEAVKVAAITSPTSLAFAPDGTLYVTDAGKPSDTNMHRGSLLKLPGNL